MSDIVQQLRLTPVLFTPDRFGAWGVDYELTAKTMNKTAADLMKRAADEIEQLHKRIKDIKEGYEGCCMACEPVGVMNTELRRVCRELQANQITSMEKEDMLVERIEDLVETFEKFIKKWKE